MSAPSPSPRPGRSRPSLPPALWQSSGVGGRSRKLNDPNEKARSAVTWRIRSAIKKIAAVHPELGKHFGNAVRPDVLLLLAGEISRLGVVKCPSKAGYLTS